MKKIIGLSGFILLIISSLNAQICYNTLKVNENIRVKYKWQENKEGEKELRIKFKTTSNSDLNIDLKLGFYHTGILEEEAQISDCLKRFFWNDWFRPLHIIQFKNLNKDQIESEEFKLEILNLSTEKIDKCANTDD